MATDAEPPDPAIWSNTLINSERQTWRQLLDLERARYQRNAKWATLASDLDRCEHGRHEGDVCSSCGGPSKGNPMWDLETRWPDDGGAMRLDKRFNGAWPDRLIGFGLDGVPICDPGRDQRGDPQAWYAVGGAHD